MNRATFFDIDGTLYKGFIIYEFPKYLTSRGLFKKQYFVEIDAHVKRYRNNQESYREASIAIPPLYASGLKGKRVDVIKEEASNFIEMYRANMLSYTMDLIRLMNKYGLTIAIGGPPIEVSSLLKNTLGIGLVYGTELKVNDGMYTGDVKRNLILNEMKEAVFEEVVRENDIDLNVSFGFGDTEQDYSILSKVGIPIALNPNNELMELVKNNNWLFFTTEDDVVSEVRKKLK